MLLYISCENNIPSHIAASYAQIKAQLDFKQKYIKNFSSQAEYWQICELSYQDMLLIKDKWQYAIKYARKDASLMDEWQDKAFIEFKAQGAFYTLASLPKVSALHLDYENLAYRQRLMRGGRQKEAVARAVMQGLNDDACVVDASAGLGRESMILAHAKAQVYCCERQLPMWILLYESLNRAKLSRYFPFTLPTLLPLGSIDKLDLASLNLNEIEVIYYDPMFPEKSNSAKVKKDMFIFQNTIGKDEDSINFLQAALKIAHKRVVVKRPNSAKPIEDHGLKVDYAIDGGQCRFDCYLIK